MMNNRVVSRLVNGRQRLALVAACLMACALLAFSSGSHAQERQRQVSTVQPRVNTTTATPAPTPTPAPTSTTNQPAQPAPTAGPRIVDRSPGNPSAVPTPTPNPDGEEYDPGDVVKVNTDLVTLNVRVVDRNNKPIHDVSQNDFRVFEDGVPQPIELFSKEELPISYGVAIDTSGSLRSQIEKVIDAGKTIVESNKPGDETFLVRFIDNEHIETVQDFTADKQALEEALDSLYVEGGQTAVIDAVYLSAERVANYKKGDDVNDRRRRALIVVTDGEDRASFYKENQLFARLREEDVQIYVIGFVNELDKEGGLIKKSPREKAVNLLNRFASETGGRAFYPNSLSELPKIAEEITRDMRTQFIISYNPTNKTPDGTFRAIRVTVNDASSRDKRIAITRAGRYATPQGRPAPKPQTAPRNNGSTSNSIAPGANKKP
jgi:Ca-activated chloride channel family protein